MAGLCLAPAGALAQDRWSALYDSATLGHWQAEFRPGLETNLRELILARLDAAERLPLVGLRLDLPLRQPGHPMNFLALRDADGPVLSMPVASLRFLGDLCLAWAWLNARGYSLDTVTDYLGMLAQRGPEAFAGGPVRPLAALGISTEARADPRVQRDLQRLFGSAVVFLMAHELGHLQLRHAAPVNAGQSRLQEREADRFALEVMRRTGEPPLGLAIYFTAVSHLEGISPAGNPGRSHPTSPERLRAAAAQLQAAAGDYARSGTQIGAIQSIAGQLDQIAQALADPDVHILVRLKGLSTSTRDLAPRRQVAVQPETSTNPWRAR
jgi:hypothetical protein